MPFFNPSRIRSSGAAIYAWTNHWQRTSDKWAPKLLSFWSCHVDFPADRHTGGSACARWRAECEASFSV